MNLLIVGSVAFDSVQTPFGKREKALGGSAVFASIASSYFCESAIVGVVGTDYPKENIQLLNQYGISTEGLEIVTGKTFVWKGIYNDLNRAETLETQLNVFMDFNPKIPQAYKGIDYIFLGNIHPELQLRVLEQMDKPKVVACDTMNFWIKGERDKLLEVIKQVDILFINEDEIKMLTGKTQIFEAVKTVRKMGAKFVVIKCGEHGAIAIKDEFVFFSPIFPVKEVIDPTGAGDCFAGGFMGYVAKQDVFDETTIKNAMIYGTVAASYNIESFSIEKLLKINTEMIENRKLKIRKSVVF